MTDDHQEHVGTVEHADVVAHADHADQVDNLNMTLTPAPRTRAERWMTLGWLVTGFLMALSLAFLAPSVYTLVRTSTAAREERQALVENSARLANDLAVERAQDDRELDQERCENAYAREVDRRRDRVAATEVEALSALAGDDDVLYATNLDAFRQASANLTAAIAARDQYVADGRPLPCPTSADG